MGPDYKRLLDAPEQQSRCLIIYCGRPIAFLGLHQCPLTDPHGLKTIQEYAPCLCPHLDVGTGTGRILELFSGHVDRSVGIDANPKMLSVARNKLSDSGIAAQVRQADVYNLAPQGNLLNTVYDLITIHQVLHYLDDPALALSEISRVAGAGSTLLIADFASHNLEFMRADYAHRRLGFSDEQMFGWLENVGFSDFETIKLEPETVSGEELTVQLWTAQKT